MAVMEGEEKGVDVVKWGPSVKYPMGRRRVVMCAVCAKSSIS